MKVVSIINKRLGFTLAEVLLTLGIIGVVATTTIPTLLQNTQDKEFKTQLKKQYSAFNQALLMIKNDYGSIETAISNCTATPRDHACFRDMLSNYMNVIKKCDNGAATGNCFPATTYYLNGTQQPDHWYTNLSSAGMILADGTSMLVFMDSADGVNHCINWVGGTNPALQNECGWVTIDVNGLKPPNKWGRDIYTLKIYLDSVKPMGVEGDNTVGDCNIGTNNGQSCAEAYLFHE